MPLWILQAMKIHPEPSKPRWIKFAQQHVKSFCLFNKLKYGFKTLLLWLDVDVMNWTTQRQRSGNILRPSMTSTSRKKNRGCWGRLRQNLYFFVWRNMILQLIHRATRVRQENQVFFFFLLFRAVNKFQFRSDRDSVSESSSESSGLTFLNRLIFNFVMKIFEKTPLAWNDCFENLYFSINCLL